MKPTLISASALSLTSGLWLGLLSAVLVSCAGAESTSTTAADTPNSPVAQASSETAAASSPTSEPSPIAELTALRSGSFASGEHETQGTVQIVQQDGSTVLTFDDTFQTSSGPDLVVILHRSGDVLGGTEPPAYPVNEGDYVVIAPLQSPTGTQQYDLPADINLADYQSVAIWCRQFNATFGAASLQ